MIHAWLRLSFANSMRKKRRIPLANPGFSAGHDRAFWARSSAGRALPL